MFGSGDTPTVTRLPSSTESFYFIERRNILAYRDLEKKRAKAREYYHKHKETNRQKAALYRSENKVKILERQRSESAKVTSMYSHMIKRSMLANRLDSLCSKEEFYIFLKSSRFDEVFKTWVKSGRDAKLAPSVDRIDCKMGYSIGNIQILTRSENSKKAHKEAKLTRISIKLSSDNSALVFCSMTEAGRWLGMTGSAFSHALKNGRGIAGYDMERIESDVFPVPNCTYCKNKQVEGGRL